MVSLLPDPVDFEHRADLSEYPELMDQPCSYEDLRLCLGDLAKVNRLTFAYRPTLHWLDHVRSVLPRLTVPLEIVDVGCGYGDTLRRIRRWATEHNLPVTLTGIDLNPLTVSVARQATDPADKITFLEGDAFSYRPDEGIDIILSSLVMHHIEEPGIVRFLDWMESNARIGWFINDLHRQRLPYAAFRFAARFTNWHRFVKHDGPVSILRSFRREDWQRIAAKAALPTNTFQLREYRPARLCVARVK